MQIAELKDQENLQEDLSKLLDWSDKWLLQFHPEKCQLMHIGHQFPTKYEMIHGKVHKLQCIQEEKDHGVYTANTLKPELQCQGCI